MPKFVSICVSNLQTQELFGDQICRCTMSNSDVPKLIVYFPLLNDKRGTKMSGFCYIA